MTKFHLIPIGPNCNVAITLRNMKIRSVSYPWDWIRDTSVEDVIGILKQGREFDVADWDCFKNMEHKMPHDYKDDSHNASELKFEGGDVLEKYKRRFKRMFDHLEDDIPTYLLRFGDGNGLDKLQEVIPSSCKIIHIENGHPDSQSTYLRIISEIGIDMSIDPYHLIINAILDINHDIEVSILSLPISYETIINFVEKINEKELINTLVEYNIDLVKIAKLIYTDSNLIYSSIDDLLKYTFSRIYEITGIEYALL